MDSMGTILEGDWSCLSGMYATDQEADFMSQLLSNFDDHADQLHGSSSNLIFWPANHASFDHTSGSYGCSSDMNSFCSSQESYYLSDSHPVFVANDNNNNNSPICMEFCMDQDGTNPTSFLVEADDCLNINVEKGDRRIEEPKRETAMAKPELIFTDKKSNNNAASENSSKKRSRNSGDQVQKTRKNARSKKNQASVSNSIAADNEEDGNAGLNGQSWASCSSEDDSNASQESKGEAAALNLNGKTRASRGAATDPQSLYARKRRERINERLRILQNLVPNGTKVDISTMLEEAVQYVKFLQLQIKLLSSDDHWMYAPIAYNGMDIGLDLKVGAPKRS